MPVGTRGAVKALDSRDLEASGAEVVLANTYHLMLRPGADTVAALGGLHRFTGWAGHTLTDSGGYQVHSLRPTVDDDGVTFASVYDGARVRLTPESAVEAQGLIGADIQMVLDVCATLPGHPRGAAAGGRPHRGLGRPGPPPPPTGSRPGPRARPCSASSRAAPTPRCGRRAPSGPWRSSFDGYGIGGLSVGEPRPAMLEALAATVPHLPADRPRYLMGVGDPVGLMEAVALGVDQFDCVAPTRMARHGAMLTSAGRLNLRNAVHARDDGPLDAGCALPHLRPLVAGLPAPPADGGGAHRLAAAQHPQPGLRARTDGRGPGGHRRGALRRPAGPHCGGVGRLRPAASVRRWAWATVGPLCRPRTPLPTIDDWPRSLAVAAGRRRGGEEVQRQQPDPR